MGVDDSTPNSGWAPAFKALDRCGVGWVVLRDADPDSRGDSDVDILVAPIRGQELDRALGEARFLRIPPRGRGSHRFPVRVREAEFCAYDASLDSWHDLDVLSEVSFGADLQYRTELAPQLLARRRLVGGVPRLHPSDEFWYLLLHELLKRGDVVGHRRQRVISLLSASDLGSPAARHLESVSPGSASRLREAALSARWELVRAIGDDVRTDWRRSRRVGVGVVSAMSKVSAFLPAPSPMGMRVAVLGSDEASVTTLAHALRRCVPLPSVYVGTEVPDDSRFETAATMRPVIGARPALRLMTLLGRSGWIELQRRLGKLVLLDRYTSDAALPSSDRIRKGRVRSLLAQLTCPEPDLVLVLDAPAELAQRFRHADLLDTAQPPEDVRRAATVLICERWAALRRRSATRRG